MAIAILGALLLQGLGGIDLDATRPQYRSETFAIGQYIVGGLLFGVGMTLGSGCGNKTMIRLGAGNLKSLVVLLSIIFSSALTMKIQYYQLVYEEEATFLGALSSSLVDLRMLPARFRQLEAV